MTSPIVPTGTDGPEATSDEPEQVDATLQTRRRRRRRLGWLAGVVVPLVAVTVAAFVVQLPYYVLQPGSLRSVGERVEVDGAEGFDDGTDIQFITVLQHRATPALLLRAALDDAMRVRSAEEVYPSGNVEEIREQNLQRMDLSKLVATRVALDHLGFEANFDADGARVLGLMEDSPSEGLLRPGDTIVEVDGAGIGMPSEIGEELEGRKPGDEVTVVVERPTEDGGTRQLSVQIVLGAAETDDGSERPILGVHVEPANPRVVSPVEVELDSGEVTGPSAGLAWALGIVDYMTPGPLGEDRTVAVTGEIFDDGRIGPVGGMEQKVAAVKRSGIELFIYPAATPEEEQREMRRIAGEEVTLEPVETFEQAVEVLAPGGVRRPH